MTEKKKHHHLVYIANVYEEKYRDAEDYGVPMRLRKTFELQALHRSSTGMISMLMAACPWRKLATIWPTEQFVPSVNLIL